MTVVVRAGGFGGPVRQLTDLGDGLRDTPTADPPRHWATAYRSTRPVTDTSDEKLDSRSYWHKRFVQILTSVHTPTRPCI